MRVGVDLGGTKIEALALGSAGEELWRRRVATPKGDYRGTIAAIVALVNKLEAELGTRGSVGVCTPGSVSRVTGRLRNCNSTVLNDKPFQVDLEQALGRDLRIANDADCFALSEARDGAAAGADSVFGVILGTGVGGGLVMGGQLLSGPNGICGEWGHNPLYMENPAAVVHRDCYCGRRNCVETWLSGPGFEQSYFESSGRHLDASDVVAAAASGDLPARNCYASYVDSLARALAVVVNIVDPDTIVLGGGMSNIPGLSNDVASCWDAHVFSDRVDTRLVVASHGDSSGVRGAAWLWAKAES